MCRRERCVECSATRLVDNAAAGPARTSDASVVATLGNAAVDTGCAGCDCLPNNLAVIAKTELISTIADHGAVFGASARAAS